jgi:hypothetical protein
MTQARSIVRGAGASLFGAVVASAVAVALAGGYREGEILIVLLSLTIPPLLLSLVYAGSEKRAVFCLGSLLIAALLFDLGPLLGLPRSGVYLVLPAVIAMAIPVTTDLLLIDMGTRLRVERRLARTVQLAFLLAVVPISFWSLVDAHHQVVSEDEKLDGELAARITPVGGALVVDRLDPKLRDRAQRRLAIRTRDKTYQLSDADVESVREERTVRRETALRGGTPGTQVTREQEERMRLILKLQGTGVPDDVVLFSHRGPLTIYEVKVSLARQGG